MGVLPSVPCSGEWGTVCSSGWGYHEALVVCNQLGYPDAMEHVTGATLGSDHGRVWMDDVNCTERNTKLDRCSFVGWDVQNCSDGTQAKVACGESRQHCVYLMFRFPLVVL